MKFCFAFVASMALVAVTLGSNDIPEELLIAAGKQLTRPMWPIFSVGQEETDAPQVASTAAPTDKCQGRATSCKDCSTLITCMPSGPNGAFELVSEDKCPSTRPFCVNNACSAASSAEGCADATPSTFKCVKGVEGYLPDPKSCQLYHFCHDGKAYDYSCPDASHAYNHQKAMCTASGKNGKKMSRGSSSKCALIDCTGKALSFITYPADPQVYALCQSDETPLLAKCDDHFQFNVTSTACERVCTGEGRQQDAHDPTKYYECTSTGGKYSKYQVIAGRCPEGTKYDEATERCKA